MGLFKPKREHLKVLFVGTECVPFARVGGLGSIMYSLPRALRNIGHDARVMIPRYLDINDGAFHLSTEYEGLKVPTDNEDGPEFLICNIKKYNGQGAKDPAPIYFLENQEYYEQRANVYGYADDPVRWALLSRGVLEFLTHSSWVPQVIVANDWQTGFLINYLKTTYRDHPIISKIACVFVIHNLFHQGMFDHKFVQEMDFDDGHSPIPGFNQPRLLRVNGMRRGIMHADMISTVSPTYAREIMTEEYGELLHDLLKERRALLYGILNGLDYDVWDPATDPYIASNFSVASLGNRGKNKTVLQERFGLPADPKAFVLGGVGRLDNQKGVDLLFPIAEALFKDLPIQLIIVGEGDTGIMANFYKLEKEYPDKVATHLKFDGILPHLVFAGADAVVVPSRFEPSGLTQMEAMRFGAVPIIRKTGGLADTVQDYCPQKNIGTGFTFTKSDPLFLMTAIVRALESYRHQDQWHLLQKRAMQQDFSWEHSAKEYVDLFARAIDMRSRSESAML